MTILRYVLKKEVVTAIRRDREIFSGFRPFERFERHIEKESKNKYPIRIKFHYDIMGGLDLEDYYIFDERAPATVLQYIKIIGIPFDYKKHETKGEPLADALSRMQLRTLATVSIFGIPNFFSTFSRCRGLEINFPRDFVLKREKATESEVPIRTHTPIRYLVLKLDRCEGMVAFPEGFERDFSTDFQNFEADYVRRIASEISPEELEKASFMFPDNLDGRIKSLSAEGLGSAKFNDIERFFEDEE